jgi:glycosyltransferase involved in cell wall biosynthesis
MPPNTHPVTTVLFIIPSLAYSGLARRLSLLAARLPRDRFRTRVVVLGGSSPWSTALRDAGVVVDELGWQRPFDARPLFALKRLASELRPDVVHAWGEAGLRAALLTGIASPRRLVVSGVLPPVRPPDWLGRGLLRLSGRVIAFGRADAERYRRLGVANERLTEAPLATDPDWPPTLPDSANPVLVDDAGRVLLGVGPFEQHKGFRDAVWTFDILQFLYDDLQLVLAGDGPDRPRVEDFARVADTARRVRFTGPLTDLTALRRRAMLAWVPGRAGGVQSALEAMSAGLPVIASRIPELAEVVVHGETGLLAAPGDKADFARQTRLLIEDDGRRRDFAEAGRRRAAEQFAPGPMTDACAGAYSRQPTR